MRHVLAYAYSTVLPGDFTWVGRAGNEGDGVSGTGTLPMHSKAYMYMYIDFLCYKLQFRSKIKPRAIPV